LQEKPADIALTCAIPESGAASAKACFQLIVPADRSNAVKTIPKNNQPTQNTT
jgi:hypothetical protein